MGRKGKFKIRFKILFRIGVMGECSERLYKEAIKKEDTKIAALNA